MTPRERDIVALLATGASRQEIADRLHLSPKTVRNRLSMLYAEYHARTALEFLLKAGVLTEAEGWDR